MPNDFGLPPQTPDYDSMIAPLPAKQDIVKPSEPESVDLEKLGKSVKEDKHKSISPTKPLTSTPQKDQTADASTVGSMVSSLSRSGSAGSRSTPISTSRELPGGRIYHLKKDILPWMENIYKSGQRVNQQLYDEFTELVVQRQDLLSNQLTEPLLEIAENLMKESNEALNQAKEDRMASPELSDDLHQEVVADKAEAAKYKGISKDAQTEVHDQIKGYMSKLKELMDRMEGVPEEAKKAIDAFIEAKQKNAGDMEGLKRFEIIHEDKMWDPDNKTVRFLPMSDSATSTSVRATSTFQAQGPGYSSQANRNRSMEDNPVAPNFWRTELLIKPQGQERDDTVMSITRSAITVEFDQGDPTKRAEVNQQLVKQVLQSQAKHKLEGMTWEQLTELAASGKPIELNSQTVNLLTPDRLRTLARESPRFQAFGSKFHHALSGAPADDERQLALENLAAHQHWDGKVIPMEVQDPSGKTTIVNVKINTRYFNIPNNVMYEKTPDSVTYSKELQAANNASWTKLEGDVKSNIDKLNQAMTTKKNQLPSHERKIVDQLLQLPSMEKLKLRQEVMTKSISSGSPKEPEKFKKWQEQGDAIAKAVRELRATTNLTPAMKEYLDLFEARENLNDLHMDTKELFDGGLGKNLKALDNNRSALASRVIALGALTENVEVHFGCRSGKDRTGLVDIEVKLLLSQAKLHGRIPSYREQEQWADTTNQREAMTMESGNVFDVVRAVLGANVGLNTGGSASKPLQETSDRGKQHTEFTKGAQAYASMASRPPTKSKIPASYTKEWQDRPIIVKHASI